MCFDAFAYAYRQLLHSNPVGRMNQILSIINLVLFRLVG